MAAKRNKIVVSDEELDILTHLRRVGCRSIAEYRAWCAANGLRDSLNKGRHEREREEALYQRLNGQAALQAARRFERHPEEVLRALAAGETAGLSLENRPHLLLLNALFGSVRRETRIRQAFLGLLLHTHRIADFDTTEQVITRYAGYGNTYAGGLLALARQHGKWLRTPASWKPASHSPRRQFSELARHLLCRYDPSAFLEAVWFRGADAKARGSQDWYVQAGNGVSLRSMLLPLHLTKRMAHVAVTAVPGGLSVEEGWRWTQVIGMGGSERLARAIIATPLGGSFENEEFWETVIRFFVDNPMLDPSRVGPLIDYLRYERFSPRRAGDRDRLPPDFTMKGRTPAALLARMEAWHRRLAKEARGAVESWEPSGIEPYRHEEEQMGAPGKTVWTIQEIITAKGLTAEGRDMCHCVATYAPSCARGSVSVWSLQVQTDRMIEPERVMTIAVGRNQAISEARGRRNALPSNGTTYGVRLSKAEVDLLSRSRRILRMWAAEQQILLPGYLHLD